MWLALLLTLVVTLLIYKLLFPSKPYWEKYGVPHMTTTNLLDIIQMIRGKKTMGDFDNVAYQKLSSTGGKFIGLVEMGMPYLLIKDLDIVKQILIKDFNHFVDRRQFVGSKKQPIMSKTVGNLEGEEWKGVRSSLSPTFTSGKIRNMMTHFNFVANDWTDHMKERILKNGKDSQLAITVKDETTSFAVDTIAASVFGMNAGTIRNPTSDFGRMADKLSNFTLLTIVKFFVAGTFPWVLDLLGICLLDHEAVSFFEQLLAHGMKERMEGKVKSNDFIQLLAEARKGELKAEGAEELSNFEKDAQLSSSPGGGGGGGKKNYLGDDQTANAQALGFFFAGFSTITNFIGFTAYMLALHPEVQEKLRGEVDSELFGKGDGKNVDYDELNRLPYLDMVVSEVLRLFPPALRLERRCVKDYYDASENLRVPKGALVSVSVHCIHHDTQYYDRPDDFYPDHFTPEAKAKRSPYAYIPFGVGPRNCIGMRFALVEGKAAIAHLVHSFRIEPTGKTPVPVKVKNAGLGVQILDDLELGLRLL